MFKKIGQGLFWFFGGICLLIEETKEKLEKISARAFLHECKEISKHIIAGVGMVAMIVVAYVIMVAFA